MAPVVDMSGGSRRWHEDGLLFFFFLLELLLEVSVLVVLDVVVGPLWEMGSNGRPPVA